MQINRGAGRFPHALQSHNVIDVRVRNDDSLNFQMVPLDDFEDSRRVVTGIDDDRFAGLRIADNVAIALQHSHRKYFVNEFLGL